jgi:hypothetical protein
MNIAKIPAMDVPPIIPIRFSKLLVGKRPVTTKLTRPIMSSINSKIASAAASFFRVSISIPAAAYRAPKIAPITVKRAVSEVVIPKKLWVKPVAISAIPNNIMRAEVTKIPMGLVSVFFFDADMHRAILGKPDKN